MPEPRELAEPRAVPLWPATLPARQGESVTMLAPVRASLHDVLSGPTRLMLTARTAPAEWTFTLFLSQAQMQAFEAFYQAAVAANDGEFYASWIGGARVVAFAEPYQYAALGGGWALSARAIRTRIDPSICDAILNAQFGAILRDDGASANFVRDDGVAADFIRDDFPLADIAAHEC